LSKLPYTWTSCSLLECSNFVRGVTYTKNDASDIEAPTCLPLVRANNIQAGKLDLRDLVYVPGTLISADQKLRAGDLVIATSSGSISVVGKAAQITSSKPMTFGAFCGVLRPRDGINFRYFGHFFSSQAYRQTVSDLARGVNINNLKRDHFRSIAIPLAPAQEQQRIADKLDTVLARVDAVNARLARVAPLLKRFRQSVLAAATSGRLTADWRITQEAAPLEDVTLQEICQTGRVVTYGVVKLGEATSGGTPCLRTSNVRWLRFELKGMKLIDPSLSAEYGRTVLRGGEVLVNVRGTLGGVAVATEEMAGWNVSREVAVVPVNEAMANPDFIALWIGSDECQRWLTGVAKGVAYTGINIEDLRALPLRLPEKLEQTEIVRRVELLFAFADRLEARLQAAQTATTRLTPSLLAKAFRGELVPQDPNDEPAAELLRRLAQTKPDTTPRGRKTRARQAT